MKNSAITVLLLLISCGAAPGQSRMTIDKGTISFFSEAPIENISAVNHMTTSIFEPETGRIAFSVPIRSFKFPKALMEEHFNDKYMESAKYPNAFFSGSIKGYALESLDSQQVVASGTMTIHGVSKEVSIPGTLEFKGKNATMNAKFSVNLKDYNIEIPQLLLMNIAESVEVTIDLTYKTE